MCFLREAVMSNQDVLTNQKIAIPIPFFYNLPLKPLAVFGAYFNVTDCNEWYLYQFEDDVPNSDREFFGKNEGFPLSKHESKGMLKGGSNILETPCAQVGKTVPYF